MVSNKILFKKKSILEVFCLLFVCFLKPPLALEPWNYKLSPKYYTKCHKFTSTELFTLLVLIVIMHYKNQNHLYWPCMLIHKRNLLPAVGISLAIHQKRGGEGLIYVYKRNDIFMCNAQHKHCTIKITFNLQYLLYTIYYRMVYNTYIIDQPVWISESYNIYL